METNDSEKSTQVFGRIFLPGSHRYTLLSLHLTPARDSPQLLSKHLSHNLSIFLVCDEITLSEKLFIVKPSQLHDGKFEGH